MDKLQNKYLEQTAIFEKQKEVILDQYETIQHLKKS